jgi:hypothetical protein
LLACKFAAYRDDWHLLICSSTQRNATDSPLLRLPGEIRNSIYSYVFGYDTHEFARPFQGTQCLPRLVLSSGWPHLDILSVCRQTQRETALLPFELSTFELELPNLNLLRGRISDVQRCAITSLCLWVAPDEASRGIMSGLESEGIELCHFLPALESVTVQFKRRTIYQRSVEGRVQAKQGRQAVKEWVESGSNEGLRVVYERVK